MNKIELANQLFNKPNFEDEQEAKGSTSGIKHGTALEHSLNGYVKVVLNERAVSTNESGAGVYLPTLQSVEAGQDVLISTETSNGITKMTVLGAAGSGDAIADVATQASDEIKEVRAQSSQTALAVEAVQHEVQTAKEIADEAKSTAKLAAEHADGTTQFHGTCMTGIDKPDKVATVDGAFELKSGVIVIIDFAEGNASPNPTLNVNSTGAKPILTNGSPYAYYVDGTTALFLYDGAAWQNCGSQVYAESITLGNPKDTNLYITRNGVEFHDANQTTAIISRKSLALPNYGLSSSDRAITQTNYTDYNHLVLSEESSIVEARYSKQGSPTIDVIASNDQYLEIQNYLHVPPTYGDGPQEVNVNTMKYSGSSYWYTDKKDGDRLWSFRYRLTPLRIGQSGLFNSDIVFGDQAKIDISIYDVNSSKGWSLTCMTDDLLMNGPLPRIKYQKQKSDMPIWYEITKPPSDYYLQTYREVVGQDPENPMGLKTVAHRVGVTIDELFQKVIPSFSKTPYMYTADFSAHPNYQNFPSSDNFKTATSIIPAFRNIDLNVQAHIMSWPWDYWKDEGTPSTRPRVDGAYESQTVAGRYKRETIVNNRSRTMQELSEKHYQVQNQSVLTDGTLSTRMAFEVDQQHMGLFAGEVKSYASENPLSSFQQPFPDLRDVLTAGIKSRDHSGYDIPGIWLLGRPFIYGSPPYSLLWYAQNASDCIVNKNASRAHWHQTRMPIWNYHVLACMGSTQAGAVGETEEDGTKVWGIMLMGPTTTWAVNMDYVDTEGHIATDGECHMFGITGGGNLYCASIKFASLGDVLNKPRISHFIQTEGMLYNIPSWTKNGTFYIKKLYGLF